MPLPQEYQRATEQFYHFLTDARDISDLGSNHLAYTMVQGMLLVFRRRLTLAQAIRFAGVLPAVLRAIFVADWNPEEPLRPFQDLSAMNLEVRQLRANHNFSTEHAITDVATALRRHVDPLAFDNVLLELPADAVRFWQSREC